MDPQAQRPVSFFAMVTDKRNAAVTKSEMRPGFQKAKVCHNACAAIIENGKITKACPKNEC
jgi:hypothetical protein